MGQSSGTDALIPQLIQATTSSDSASSQSADAALWFGENAGYWLQTGLSLIEVVAILVGLAIALGQLARSVETSTKKASMDVIFEGKRDDKLQEGYAEVRRLHTDPDIRVEEYAYERSRAKPEFKHILYVLNHYENICVGINHGVYDENVIKAAEKTIIVRAYEMMRPFIQEVRSQNSNPGLYCQLEGIAQRWGAGDLILPTSPLQSLRRPNGNGR